MLGTHLISAYQAAFEKVERRWRLSIVRTETPRLPPEQQALRDKCFHPTGKFIEFEKKDVEGSIPDRFREQVKLYPERIAVKDTDQELTYLELDESSNRIAQAILREQVCRSLPIVLLLEHGVRPAIGLLGILKAGMAFLPLDPSNPTSRNANILKTSGANLIVTSSEQLSLALKLSQDRLRLLNIDKLDLGISAGDPSVCIAPTALSSIIYTSGSTGQPKGVVHNHRNLLHMVRNETNSFHLCSADRLSQTHSICHSSGVKEILNALLNGAALLPFDISANGVAYLAGWLLEQEITFCHLVASVYRQLVSTLTGKEEFPRLRIIKSGSEPTYTRDFEAYRKYFPQSCLFSSGMGCTEINPMAMFMADHTSQIRGSTVPAGYAFEGTDVLLVDNNCSPVSLGEVGEIAVRSEYVATGYWRDSELSQEAFLPDPRGGEPRIYFTGDLGSSEADGCLRHLGRKDFQVKVNGNRIEIAEIETVLLTLDNIKEAAVMAHTDQTGNQRLVGYVVPGKKPGPTIRHLRRGLNAKLPIHMVPSAFVILDSLPVTPTGKLDRRSLPPIEGARPEIQNSFVEPRNSVEEQLVEIWCEVLGLDQVGIHDDFLELGGDSLLAGQVISRLINNFSMNVPARLLFQAPTVAEMSRLVSGYLVLKADQGQLEQMVAELETE